MSVDNSRAGIASNNDQRHPQIRVAVMRYKQWKYSLLLATICVLLLVRLFLRAMPLGFVAIDLSVGAVVVAGLSAACTRKHSRIMALVLAFPPLALTALFHIAPSERLHLMFILQRATMSLFLAFLIITILQDLIEQREIQRDAIVGAFCGYVLIGALWTEMYCWADLVIPHAFQPNDGLDQHIPSDIRWDHLLYFSFVTLTTVGYGDLVPTSTVTRLLACTEAICGQFYLAVLVAGLVGIRVGQLASARPPSDDDDPPR